MDVANEVIVGRFHLRTSRGAGAWGELFNAEDKPKYGALAGGLATQGSHAASNGVVIEVVHPASLPDGIKVDAIEREMKAFKSVASPHLLECLDSGRETAGHSQGLLYLAMESWTDSLNYRLKSATTISDQELDVIARSVSQALVCLHSSGIHHAGVHPGRIVCVGDNWKLGPSGPLAAAGPRILPPESRTGPAEDVYAFGLTFLHAFLAVRGHLIPLDSLASDHERWLAFLPEALRNSLARCLQKDPKRRCTVDDLVSANKSHSRPVIDWTLAQSHEGNGVVADLKRKEQIEKSAIADLEQRKRELESEVNKLEADIEAARNDRTIRLGVFGVRGSGKSSLLAVWSLFCVDRSDPARELQLRFPDDDSLRYLKEVRAPILKEGRSHATAMAEPKTILLEIVVDGEAGREVWKIETMDFSGEFVELMADKTGVKAFATQTHDFLQKADVILCCHRWNDNSQETLEAINRVLAEFRSHFILALTRMDERGDVPRSKEDLENILQVMEQDSPVYFGNLIANIKDIFRRTGRAAIMAICPLGKNFSDPRHFPRGRELTVEDLKPIAIHEPLRCAVDRKKEAEPRLQQRLQQLKAELASMGAVFGTATATRERQRQAQREKLREELSELRESLLQRLDKGQTPHRVDRNSLSRMAQRARELDDPAMKHECSELLKRIANERERVAARRRRLLELAVLLILALLFAVPLLWFAWFSTSE